MKIKYYNPPLNSLDLRYVQAYNSLNVNYENSYTSVINLLFTTADNSISLNYFNGFINNLNLIYNNSKSNALKAQYKIMDNGLDINYSNAKYLNSLKLNYTNVEADVYSNSLTIKYTLFEEVEVELIADFKTSLHTQSRLDLGLESAVKGVFQTTAINLRLGDFEFLEQSFKISAVTDVILDINGVSSSNLYILSPPPAFEVLAVLDDAIDIMWEYKWREADTFELTTTVTSDNAGYLQLGNYIAKGEGSFLNIAKITNRKLEKTDSLEKITISGKSVESIFENKIAFNNVNVGDGYDTFRGPAESAMKHYINSNVVNPTDPDRKIGSLEIELDKGRGQDIAYKARFQKLSKILYDISKLAGLGWELVLNIETSKLLFKVKTSEIKPYIKLSTEMDSVNVTHFEESDNYAESNLILAGQGEGSERLIKSYSKEDFS